jgi:hypothetical protein
MPGWSDTRYQQSQRTVEDEPCDFVDLDYIENELVSQIEVERDYELREASDD